MAHLKPFRFIVLLLAFLSIAGCTDLDDNLKIAKPQDVIAKDSDLYNLLENVTAPTGNPLEKIVCLDFVYPFTVLVYDENLQVTDSRLLAGDAEFSEFLGQLPQGQSISISYPIETTLADGSLFSVHNNDELKLAIDSCSREDIINYCNGLFGGTPSCVWKVPYTPDGDNRYSGGVFSANGDGSLTFNYNNQDYTGTWTFLFVDDKFHININLQGNSQVAMDWNIDREAEIGETLITINNLPHNILLARSCEETAVYHIGDPGPAGGIVFYDKGSYTNGWRYMEAATEDLGVFQWGCMGSQVQPAADAEIGSGLINSARTASFHDALAAYYTNPSVCNALNDGTVAAQKALLYDHLDYKDWFLPSEKELAKLYENCYLNGTGNLSGNFYWSSTEKDGNTARALDFNSGIFQDAAKIPGADIVKTRTVRYF